MDINVKAKPILFSGPMVLAIMEGRKTQTRRVLKGDTDAPVEEPYELGHEGEGAWFSCATDGTTSIVFCPYGQSGDRLWVRETWASHFNQRFHDEHGLSAPDFLVDVAKEPLIVYAADRQFPMLINDEFIAEHSHIAWKSPIHMRRAASRVTLEITAIRVERLQEISEADIRAEGIDGAYCESLGEDAHRDPSPLEAWCHGWDKLNAKRGYSWESNPWVWVIEFKKVDSANVPTAAQRGAQQQRLS